MIRRGPLPERGKRPVGARCGFTLIELLVVISVLAMLVGILVPTLSRVRELARRAKCSTNLHNMGTAWQQLWAVNDRRFPGISGGDILGHGDDPISQFDYAIIQNRRFRNTGVLYQKGFLDSPDVFICPTIVKSIAQPWFDDLAGAFLTDKPNPWPPAEGQSARHTRMTYGTRRMTYYRDSSLAGPDPEPPPAPCKHEGIMLRKIPLAGIKNPGSFSFMADCFNWPFIAEYSHVPGVNVLYLSGRVKFFTDNTPNREILYNNGIPYNGGIQIYNWKHDDIWMVIDGYHDPPVGP